MALWRKISWKPIFIVALAVLIFAVFHFQLRYFASVNQEILVIQPVTKIIKPATFECSNKPNKYTLQQKGKFWVLNNYIRANRWFACHESITLTTISDPSHLEDLRTLVERWNGPISVAVYTPGTDMEIALQIIGYLRMCYPKLIKEYVSFHFFFETEHIPQSVPSHRDTPAEQLDLCLRPLQMVNSSQLYRQQKGLAFPINVGRNIARDAATTHFIFANDIELFPSPDVITNFLDMIQQNAHYLQTPCVFVLPPFEVETNISVPSSKSDLLLMLANGSAIPFHKKICSDCHAIPGYGDWLKANKSEGLQVIYTTKKRGYWEPFYIGTNQEPYFDERLDWEGRCNKIIQAYSMCVLGYEYHILDNAFLAHKPGIKKISNVDIIRNKYAQKTVQRILKEIEPDIDILYGRNKNCSRIFYC